MTTTMLPLHRRQKSRVTSTPESRSTVRLTQQAARPIISARPARPLPCRRRLTWSCASERDSAPSAAACASVPMLLSASAAFARSIATCAAPSSISADRTAISVRIDTRSGQYLREPSAGGKESLLAALEDAQLSRLKRGDQWNMERQDAELTVEPGDRDHIDILRKRLRLRRDHFEFQRWHKWIDLETAPRLQRSARYALTMSIPPFM